MVNFNLQKRGRCAWLSTGTPQDALPNLGDNVSPKVIALADSCGI